jgi:hypothetical protein
MATALEPLVAYPDPSSPTVATDTAAIMAGLPPPFAPPLRPEPARAAPASRVARAPRAIAGPLVVLLIVGSVVGAALLVAALPGGDEGGIAVATASPRPTRTPAATARPTARPTPTARPAPPTATPRATPRPPGVAGDLCEPILGFACGLGAGTYEPSSFEPAVRFVLGEGWSTILSEPDIAALGRPEGVFTMAGSVSAVYPSGEPTAPPRSARALVEVLVGTDGVAASKPVERRVDKRKATVVDLAPTGSERVAIFGTAGQTFYIEVYGTTRVIVVDAKDGPLVIAIEPSEGSRLEDVLPAAEAVVDSLRFR